jgi:hypothetical protein
MIDHHHHLGGIGALFYITWKNKNCTGDVNPLFGDVYLFLVPYNTSPVRDALIDVR